jgi:hypothetical protein
VYVLPLAIVVAIVYWLASTAFGLLLTNVVDPSLKRAYREDGGRNRLGYRRSLAGAQVLAILATLAAVYATCGYYAENNRPAWLAWVVFGVTFVTLSAPRLIDAALRVVR